MERQAGTRRVRAKGTRVQAGMSIGQPREVRMGRKGKDSRLRRGAGPEGMLGRLGGVENAEAKGNGTWGQQGKGAAGCDSARAAQVLVPGPAPRGPRLSAPVTPPPLALRPRGGSGEIPLPGDFWNPGVVLPTRSQNPVPSTPLRAVPTATFPHGRCPGYPARSGPAPRLCSLLPLSRGSPDRAGHPLPRCPHRHHQGTKT